jgi:hypothetical protein
MPVGMRFAVLLGMVAACDSPKATPADASAEDSTRDAQTVLECPARTITPQCSVDGVCWVYPVLRHEDVVSIGNAGCDYGLLTQREFSSARAPYVLGSSLVRLPDLPVRINDVTTAQPFIDIVARAANDVWATPYCCDSMAGHVRGNVPFHFDGASWTPADTGGWLSRVSAVDTDVWYSSDSRSFTNPGTALLRISGNEVTGYPLDAQYKALARVTGLAKNDARTFSMAPPYTVGPTPSTVLHFDGAVWSPEGTLATFGRAGWPSEQSRFYVAGSDGPSDDSSPTIEVWDGHASSLVYADANVRGVLTSIYGGWAGGYEFESAPSNRRVALLLHFDGTTWQRVPVPLCSIITSIAGTSDHDVLIAGDRGYLGHWNGSELVELAPATSPAAFSRAWAAVNGTEIVAFFIGAGVATFDSSTKLWRPIPTSPARFLVDISGTSATDVWAADGQFEMWHWYGSAWTPTSVAATNEYLDVVHAHSTIDIWAAGHNSDSTAAVIFHSDGATWTRITPPAAASSAKAIGGSATDAWLATGALFRWNGQQWSPVTTPVTDTWSVIAVGAPNDVYIGGARYLLHWNGATLTSNDFGTPIRAIEPTPTGAIVTDGARLVRVDATGLHPIAADSVSPIIGLRAAGAVTWFFDRDSGVLRR